jgi:nucleotide-binding universal stress UspA family protein
MVAGRIKWHFCTNQMHYISKHYLIMKTILIPIDLSPQSYYSAHFGLELAEKIEADLLLLHVVRPTPAAPIMSIPMVDLGVHKNYLNDQVIIDLRKFEEDLNVYKREVEMHGVKIQIQTVLGQPAEAILEVVRAEQPAFVVMGTVGASNAWNKMVGSVSSAVAQEITCPLWILPHAVRLDTLRKFAYFAELEGNEVSCINQVIDLGERLRAKMNVVHVTHGGEEEFLEAETITEMFEAAYATKRITFQNLMYDTVAKGIEAYVHIHWPDAVVLAHHERGMIARLLHRSMIHQLAQTTRRPLLIIQKPS